MLGLGKFWTAKQFQKWLAEEHQVDLSVKGSPLSLGKARRALESAPSQSHQKR